MESTENIQRLYWPIGQVANAFNIAPSRIRIWLDYLGIDVSHRRVNRRQFNEKEFQLIGKIKHLVDDRGFTLRGMKMELEKLGYLKNGKCCY